ncbi:MAG: hypothetical protein ABSD89_07280 [Halobacteriota archaeon]|jgi:hypothetical protein
MAREITIKNVKDTLAAGSNIIESAQNEVVWILPPNYLAYSFQFSIPEKSKMLIEKGGRVRGITKISGAYLDPVRKLLDSGEELRHIDQFPGVFMLVADNKESISSMSINAENLTLDDPTVALWTDNKAQAEFLTATFETTWNEAVDAKKRLREL